jgi:hypothetical protein
LHPKDHRRFERRFFEEGLEFLEGYLDGVEVWAIGRLEARLGAGGPMAWRAGGLSIMTMSPGASDGANICST